MKHVLFTAALIAFGLLSVAGCKKEENPANTNNNTGGTTGGTITITVGSGLNPTYTWSGGNVYQLSVVRVSAPSVIVWGAATPGANTIASPVTHGTLPAGAVQTSFSNTETRLTAGVAYRVNVTRLDGSFGFTEFTP